MKSLSLIMSTVLVLTSCASIFNGTTEKFHLRSDDPTTKIYMDNQEIGTGSASVTVPKKGMADITFSAKKQGCSDAMTEIQTKFNPNTLWGLLLDLGIVSILIIDWGINGSTREASQKSYVLNPSCGKI